MKCNAIVSFIKKKFLNIVPWIKFMSYVLYHYASFNINYRMYRSKILVLFGKNFRTSDKRVKEDIRR